MQHRGFSIFEIMVAMAIMAALLAAGVPLSIRFYQTYQLTSLSETALGMYRSAQERARSGLGPFGIHAEAGSITLFRGPSYLSRLAAFDERETLPSSITPSGTLDIVFTIPLGRPNAAGSLTLQNSYRQAVISINSQGLVKIQ